MMPLVVVVLTVVLGIVLLGLVRVHSRRRGLEEALLDFFAAVGCGHDLLQVAVEADWVALRLAGLEADAAVGALPTLAQARVRLLAEEVIGAAEGLMRAGLLRRVPLGFQSLGRPEPYRPPRGLFMLTPRGAALVLSRSASHAAAA